MNNLHFSRTKLILFSLITLGGFFISLEFTARVVLSLRRHSLEYLFYGLKHLEQWKRLRKIEVKEGESYYIGVPSNDKKNPVNQLGLRGPEVQPKKSGITRIVCLGGSTTYGEGLPYKDTYPAILQDKLDKKYGRGLYEVINAGQPGMTLPQIISFTKQCILSLKPDLVILMNINNNLHAPGFWFVGINDPDNSSSLKKNHQPERETVILKRWKHFLGRRFNLLKTKMIRHLAFAYLLDEIIPSPVDRYFFNFDWKAFSKALIAENNIWEAPFREDLNNEIRLLLEDNPAVKIILLGEAVNTIKYPELGAPFNRAKEIMREMSRLYKNVYMVDIQNAIISAAKEGRKVWQIPSHDPLHLTGEGNRIIAEELVNELSKISFEYLRKV